ncbi:hypothetical protein BKA61DRAFT_581966 [Leptodontidium sp. MPI-SDFR-AT-0119]|nr:hypothetical protein BKA61DRAFT_581966 [Leptodontidium sp. MPI-SDFR-AT-0119]
MFTTKFTPSANSNSNPAQSSSTSLASKFTEVISTMAYVSVFRTIAFIAVKSGLFRSHDSFEEEFTTIENETRRVLGIESRVPDDLRDFFEYKVESEFWYSFFDKPHSRGRLKHDVGPFPGIHVPDPRQPRNQPQQQQPKLYSAKCFQTNVLRAFLGQGGRYVKALGEKFLGNLVFHAEKRVDGTYWIWVEPRGGIEITKLVKEQLEEAHKLLKAYSEVPGKILPHLEDFLEDYLDGKYVCYIDRPENEMMDEAEPVVDQERSIDQPADYQADVGAGLPFQTTRSTTWPSNPLKRAAAISEDEETRDNKSRRKSRHPGPPAPALYEECAKLCGAFHRAFQGDPERQNRPDGPTMPEKEKKEKKKKKSAGKKKMKKDRRF